MIKPKISKQKPIWSPKLEKEFQQELKNSSKISVIKERLNKNIGKVVYLMLNNINKSNSLYVNFKGKLTSSESNPNYYEVECESLDYIQFSIKNIRSVTINGKTITIRLKSKL